MARWRIVAGVGIVVVLAVVTAFVVANSLRGEPEVIASEPVVAAPSPSATPTTDPDPMPELHNTGDDFDRIYSSIEGFRDWLFRNPSPDLVDRIYAQECECYSALREKLALLERDGVRFASGDIHIKELVVMDREADAVALRVVDESDPVVVVDGSGEVVDRSDGWEAKAYRYLLKRDDSGRWLVLDIASMALDADFVSEGV